ncbi:hypothetical protein GWK47_031599 [Chionoecetes opilio]|uniref:Uncharacterized protein n=1 Tax=Chionoecetes opilio TaxID=41210 RepID=A0A8J4Z0U8_CHIOP|nr:hypothetical protein GWK47_031599 [Chionoecetes opilio]
MKLKSLSLQEKVKVLARMDAGLAENLWSSKPFSNLLRHPTPQQHGMTLFLSSKNRTEKLHRSRSFVPRSHGSHASQLPARNILTTDRTNLEKAFNHRIETGCSIRTACNLFGVKVSTLGDAFTPVPSMESDGRTFVPKHQNIKKVFTDCAGTLHRGILDQDLAHVLRAVDESFQEDVLKYAEAVGIPAIF